MPAQRWLHIWCPLPCHPDTTRLPHLPRTPTSCPSFSSRLILLAFPRPSPFPSRSLSFLLSGRPDDPRLVFYPFGKACNSTASQPWVKTGSSASSSSLAVSPSTSSSMASTSSSSPMVGTPRFVSPFFPCLPPFPFSSQWRILSGYQQEAVRSQRPHLVRLDVPRCRSRPCLRWWPDPRPHVAQHHSCRSPPHHLALPRRREHLVPPSGRLLDGFLGHGPHHRSLHQLLQR